MTGQDVFISYSREDRAAARHFAKCLGAEGLAVWWDAALHSGETFDEVIERELKAASAAIVLWSPRSVVSRWVRAEATLADRQGKLVPVIIEKCDRPIIFELSHTTDLSDWAGDTSDPRWESLVQDVRRLVQRKGSGDPAPGRPATAIPPPRQAQRYASRIEDSQATQFYTGSPLADIYHCLELDDGERSHQRFVVRPPGLKIGRLPPSDIILSDRQVSRTHCLVELAGDGIRVSDLGSTNGTFIDGKRIEGSASLPIGSKLRVGSVSLQYQLRTAKNVGDQQSQLARPLSQAK